LKFDNDLNLREHVGIDLAFTWTNQLLSKIEYAMEICSGKTRDNDRSRYWVGDGGLRGDDFSV
jgi:hypothetical protein